MTNKQTRQHIMLAFSNYFPYALVTTAGHGLCFPLFTHRLQGHGSNYTHAPNHGMAHDPATVAFNTD